MSSAEPWPTSAYYSPDRPRPHSGLGLAALVVAALLALSQVAAALAAIPIAKEIEDGAASLENASLAALGIYLVGGLLTVPLLLAAWIVTGIWLLKARQTAETLSPFARQRRAAAWVFLGWVVPIANLFVPFQVVRDLYESAVARRLTGLLGWWWTAWLVGLVISRIQESRLENLRAGDSAQTVLTLSLIMAVVTTIGIALWVLILRAIIVGQLAQARDWTPPTFSGPGLR